MGAIIFADYYLLQKINLSTYYSEKTGINWNWAAALTWFIMLAAALILFVFYKVEVFFLPIPVWFVSIGLFVLMSKIIQKRNV
jgi:hypothetical protein